MNGKTTWVLLLLIAVLAGAVYFQREAEEDTLLVDRALFEGIDVNAVHTIRIDSLKRSFNMKLERDSLGQWYLTDPINYPAAFAMVELLLDDIAGARAMPVPENERGVKELGFDPPQFVMEVEQTSATGEHRAMLIEVGAEDLDGMRLNVRADGVYLRCLRRLHSTLDHNLDDFRSRHPLTLGPESIVEVVRSGEVLYELDGEPVSQELVAIRDGHQWYATAPRQALLGNLDIGVFIISALRMEVMEFVTDEVQDLSQFGLDYPSARLEFKTASGVSEVLLLGRIGSRRPWYLTRTGTPYVWAITDETGFRLLTPFGGLVDQRFMRVRRDDVQQIELRQDQELTRLERAKQGWMVSWSSGGEGFSNALLADEARVDDLLGELEELEFENSIELEEQARMSFVNAGAIRIRAGQAEFGGHFALDAEKRVTLFQRFGDEVILAGAEGMARLAGTPAKTFRSNLLVGLTEMNLRSLSLSMGERSAEFERDGQGIWHRAGEESEALDLLPQLDVMIYLRAQSFLDSPIDRGQVMRLSFVPFEGEHTVFELFLDAEGNSCAEVDGAQSKLKAADLYQSLSVLLGT